MRRFDGRKRCSAIFFLSRVKGGGRVPWSAGVAVEVLRWIVSAWSDAKLPSYDGCRGAAAWVCEEQREHWEHQAKICRERLFDLEGQAAQLDFFKSRSEWCETHLLLVFLGIGFLCGLLLGICFTWSLHSGGQVWRVWWAF